MTLLAGNFPQAALPLAETVNADSDPDKEVLTVMSYETGIYTLTDCLPPIRFFCTPNFYTEELVREQTDYLTSLKAKYLIRKSEVPIDLPPDYLLVQETTEASRPEFLLHPLEFLWSLGYMKEFIERFYTPEHRLVTYSLYCRSVRR